MKIKNVFDEIFSIDNLYAALEDASQGRRYNKDALIYNLDVWAMVQEIRNEIFNGTYSIDRYYIFYVYEPKKENDNVNFIQTQNCPVGYLPGNKSCSG